MSSSRKYFLYILFIYGLMLLLSSCGGGTAGTGGTGSFGRTAFLGKLVDQNQAPIPKAVVSILETGDQAITEVDGTFSLDAELTDDITTLLVESDNQQASAQLQDVSASVEEVRLQLELNRKANQLTVKSKDVKQRPTPLPTRTPKPKPTKKVEVPISTAVPGITPEQVVTPDIAVGAPTESPTPISEIPTPTLTPIPTETSTPTPTSTLVFEETATPNATPTIVFEETTVPTVIPGGDVTSVLITISRSQSNLRSGGITFKQGGIGGAAFKFSGTSRSSRFSFKARNIEGEGILQVSIQGYRSVTVSLGKLPKAPIRVRVSLSLKGVLSKKPKQGSLSVKLVAIAIQEKEDDVLSTPSPVPSPTLSDK